VDKWRPDKEKMKDKMHRPLTQGLFLETQYGPFAYYTLKDEDYEKDGVLYKSLKKLYLDIRDPIEYEFARTYLLGWDHWRRICANKQLKKEVDKWRYELELLIRSEAIAMIQDLAERDSSFQAAKFLADRGWEKNGRGRPRKEDIEHNTRLAQIINGEYDDDLDRVNTKLAH
jgi:hypothetical protein